MNEQIKAPGRSVLWTEAALRALTGTAFLYHEDTDADTPHGSMTPDYARVIALDAMTIATAFEQECVEQVEAEQEARRERVRAIGRFRSPSGTLLTVERVEGDVVTFVDDESKQRVVKIEFVLDEEYYEPEPIDVPTTAGREERA